MAKWLQDRADAYVKTEQLVPAWTKRDAKRELIQGKLDVTWREGRKEHDLDVTVAVTTTPSIGAQHDRAAGPN
eukprot:12918286-Prorocentrum_lima.AAC.1